MKPGLCDGLTTKQRFTIESEFGMLVILPLFEFFNAGFKTNYLYFVQPSQEKRQIFYRSDMAVRQCDLGCNGLDLKNFILFVTEWYSHVTWCALNFSNSCPVQLPFSGPIV